MQFRDTKNVVPVVLYASVPEQLAAKVAMLGKEYKLIDLQYSTHRTEVERKTDKGVEIVGMDVFSCFILAEVPEEKLKEAQALAEKQKAKNDQTLKQAAEQMQDVKVAAENVPVKQEEKK